MAEYIKREDLQNMLDNAQIITDAEGEYFGYCTEDVDINSIPAADVRENVRGEWIECEEADYNWKCSRCNCGYTDYRLSYCYDCGADMRGNDNV